MSESGRNVVVGLFVLLGLSVLGLLIIKFQTTVGYFRGSGDYYIEIESAITADIRTGQNVHLNGKRIGQIRSVELAEDPRQGVVIVAAINQKYSIPEDVKEVYIFQGQMGPPHIEIKAFASHSAVMMDKTPGEVVARLQAKIPPGAFSEISVLVEELRPALKELGPALAKIGDLAENLNAMFGGTTGGDGAGPDGQGQAEGVDLQALAKQFSQTLAKLDSFLGDEQNKENFKQSLVNLRQAGADASEALAELKGFAGQAQQTVSDLGPSLREAAQGIIDNSEQVSKLLAELNRAAEQVNQGQGTAGKILYDPGLYEEMLMTSKQLNEAVLLLNNMLKKWNKEGVKLKW